MSPPSYRIRRATVEDLAVLRPLWDEMRLFAPELEKRLTEFQVAESPEGRVVGAVGFHMAAHNGRIHSEAFADFGVADSVRPLFWERLQVLATNHGIFRVWTREQAPFWKQNGLQPAGPEALQKLPPGWGGPEEPWLTLQLKNEDAIASVEKEVAMLMMAEKDRTARTLEKAAKLKTFVTVIAFVCFFLLAGVAIYLYLRYRSGGGTPR